MKLKNRYKIVKVIPVASMSDIAFLLLIFMILTSFLSPAPSRQIVLPEAPGAKPIKQEKGLRLYIDNSEHCRINQAGFKWEQLPDQLSIIANKKQPVYLYAPGHCPFFKIDRVLQTLKKNRFKQVTFVCLQDKTGPKK